MIPFFIETIPIQTGEIVLRVLKNVPEQPVFIQQKVPTSLLALSLFR
jgi:hypothetical protein